MADLSDAEIDAVRKEFRTVRLDPDNLPYFAGLLRREYRINRCAHCGLWHNPPRSVCPKCWSRDVVPTPISGKGRIYMYSILYTGPRIDGLDYEAGVPFVIVELAEQTALRVAGILLDAEPRIGDDVVLEWTTMDGHVHPAFRAVGSRDGQEN